MQNSRSGRLLASTTWTTGSTCVTPPDHSRQGGRGQRPVPLWTRRSASLGCSAAPPEITMRLTCRARSHHRVMPSSRGNALHLTALSILRPAEPFHWGTAGSWTWADGSPVLSADQGRSTPPLRRTRPCPDSTGNSGTTTPDEGLPRPVTRADEDAPGQGQDGGLDVGGAQQQQRGGHSLKEREGTVRSGTQRRSPEGRGVCSGP